MSELTHPLQALLIAPDHVRRIAVVRGTATASIRMGHRDYRPGPMLIACHLVPWSVMVTVWDVSHCTFRDVSQLEHEAAGFKTHAAFIDDMCKHYPGVTDDSPVTVIRWQDPKGFLVDHADLYRDRPEAVYEKIRTK